MKGGWLIKSYCQERSYLKGEMTIVVVDKNENKEET
jgi:hypothetical protein